MWPLTQLVLLGALGEDVLHASADAIPVEVMGLKEACPELLLSKVMRHILWILLFDCRQTERESAYVS